MSPSLPGRRKTGPKPTFSLADVVAAAVKIGLDRMTLAAVAQELGVAAPSLYRVVSSREDLLDRCMARAAQDLVLPDPGLPWQQQLRDYANACWDLHSRYPGLTTALIQVPGAHAHIQDYLDKLIAGLRQVDIPANDERIHFTIDFIADTVLITHLFVQTMRSQTAAGDPALQVARERLAAQRPDGDVHFPAEECWLDRGFLDEKIDFIIAGIEAGH
ncbi:TetR/AcrR family transcriptional regulator [Gephyromycinifex aptenodytis]|uniref:TetR/AcrR family transcriptional regulator n=1 Tax=Gephyromycinifex aptenodytis TaxID=2716227 RepID=UPI0014454C6E|nr:TetR/AcrR family transcriptional regulator [Gephyromycinifex aptenodytis]